MHLFFNLYQNKYKKIRLINTNISKAIEEEVYFFNVNSIF